MPLPNLNLNLGVYSPYGPRRRRSAKLVVVWILGFFFLVFVMWYLPSLDRSLARSSGLRGGMEGVRLEDVEDLVVEDGGEGKDGKDGVVVGKGKGKSVRFGTSGGREEGG